MKKNPLIKYISFSVLFLFTVACDDLNTVNNNNPSRDELLNTGADLQTVLQGGYIAFWQAVHEVHPTMALMVTADAYSISWGNCGMQRMGDEPRKAYNNRSHEDPDYQQVAEDPWYGCLSAVSTANDILNALDKGVGIDNGGDQDKTIRAAAHFLRAVSWGYLGLIFDQTLIVYENDDLSGAIPFTPYQGAIKAAAAEMEEAIRLADSAADGFFHNYFNGVDLDKEEFKQLSHSYAARFLTQWPRTETENQQVDWEAVRQHAQQGIDFNFAPEADGSFWQSYHRLAFRETGWGPFWARVDQRLVGAMDPFQPTRYPETQAKGEEPIPIREATSKDARLKSDFFFESENNFPAERGEWHFSHYKHNRNITDPGFAGNGASFGPMPVFLAADNDLLKAEAELHLGKKINALNILNAGTRASRGNLAPLSNDSSEEVVLKAIMYERAIELLSTAPFSLWMDRRRIGPRQPFSQIDDLGGLQIGTPAHLPVPADEMAVQGLTPYNFGGPQDPEGIVGF